MHKYSELTLNKLFHRMRSTLIRKFNYWYIRYHNIIYTQYKWLVFWSFLLMRVTWKKAAITNYPKTFSKQFLKIYLVKPIIRSLHWQFKVLSKWTIMNSKPACASIVIDINKLTANKIVKLLILRCRQRSKLLWLVRTRRNNHNYYLLSRVRLTVRIYTIFTTIVPFLLINLFNARKSVLIVIH